MGKFFDSVKKKTNKALSKKYVTDKKKEGKEQKVAMAMVSKIKRNVKAWAQSKIDIAASGGARSVKINLLPAPPNSSLEEVRVYNEANSELGGFLSAEGFQVSDETKSEYGSTTFITVSWED